MTQEPSSQQQAEEKMKKAYELHGLNYPPSTTDNLHLNLDEEKINKLIDRLLSNKGLQFKSQRTKTLLQDMLLILWRGKEVEFENKIIEFEASNQ